MSAGRGGLVFRPFSILYLVLLLFLFFATLSTITLFYRALLVRGVGVPPEAFGAVLFLSLFGSYVNIPFTVVETRAPVVRHREVRLFWVTWRIPRVEMGVRKTLVTVNVGGAVVPLLISLYLLIYSIPACSPNLAATYLKALVVLITVTVTIKNSVRIVPGLGIATPAFGPPAVTALATLLINWVSPVSCPTQIAYVGGTLGALIGADLLNLNKIAGIGAPVVSIGGAGTFDGIYVTGLVSVALVLLLL